MKKVFGLLLAITLLVTILSFPPSVGATDNWVSPTGHNDLDAWSDEAKVYDGLAGYYGYTTTSDGELELTIGAIFCDKIRLIAIDYNGGENNPTVTISVYYGSAYHEIFSGLIAQGRWVEKAIGSTQTVTKAKISGTIAGTLKLYEFELNSLFLPTVETDACSNVKSTSFDANGDITAGSATTRGFHYSKVFDGFEWGSDTDPLSDDGGAIDWTITVAGTSKVEIDTAQHYTGTRSARIYYDGANIPIAYFPQSAVSATQVIDLWFRKEDAANFILNHQNGTYGIVVLHRSSEQLSYYDDGGYNDLGLVSADAWHRLIIQNVNWATQTYDIYLDGVLVKSGATMWTASFYDNNIVFRNTASGSVNLDEVAVWDVEDEDGSFGTGEYSLEITGLDHSTTYYVQAFAKNSAGFGYGNVVSQLTLTPAEYSWGSIIG